MSLIILIVKARDLISVKRKLILLYLLNVTDIIFTILLFNTGMFTEANILMAPLIKNDQLLGLSIKVLIPLILMIGVYLRIHKATEKQLSIANVLITGCLIFYGLINISHIVWSIMYAMI